MAPARVNEGRGALARLRDSDVLFVPRDPARGIIRLVTSFQALDDEVRQFRAALHTARAGDS